MSAQLSAALTPKLGEIRTDWKLEEVRELFALPFADLDQDRRVSRRLLLLFTKHPFRNRSPK